jgi:hypothetical protein
MTSSNACVTGTRHWAAWLALAAACTTVPAAAQQPSQEQISAIRSNCRSDYMAHCSSVPPGGAESLQCLERNLAQLSGACRSAVSAAMPKPAPAAAASTPPQQAPAHPTAASTSPQPATHTTAPHAPAPHATAPASPAPHAAPAARPPSTAAATPGAPPPPALIPLAPMPPLPLRVELLLLRVCAADRTVHCSVVQPGGGRIIACLADYEPALLPDCKEAMAEAKKYD